MTGTTTRPEIPHIRQTENRSPRSGLDYSRQVGVFLICVILLVLPLSWGQYAQTDLGGEYVVNLFLNEAS